MKKPSPAFQIIIFILLSFWFLVLSTAFFINSPIAILALIPDLAVLGVVILAAYSLGSYALEILQIDEVLPTEDFVLSTALGLGGLSLLTMLVALLGQLTWWTISIGLILAIVAGFNRIIGLLTPPTYLFGPEDLADEAPSLLSWTQYIVIGVWIVALFHFCLLPPVISESLVTTLGQPSQWIITKAVEPASGALPETISTTSGIYALALALRGHHLAMMVSALIGGLTLTFLYSCSKRYCGPEAARSTFLIAASLPIFGYELLSPGNGMMMVLFQIGAFFCVLRWFDERQRRWSVISGFLIGLSLTVSLQAIFFVAPLIVAALWWAINQKKITRFLFHLVYGAGAAAITLIPWIGIHAYLFKTPFTLLQPLYQLNPQPLGQALISMVSIPFHISFPHGFQPMWQIVGPIFLVFVPFYFLTVRKNPMSGLAVAIGLSALVFGKPFGVGLENRMISLLLLSIPAAMAAHRLVEKGWKRTVTLSMLYALIFMHIFHSTSIVESLFSSPHRFLLGIENENVYLERSVDYYPVAQAVNDILPQHAHLLSINSDGLLYYKRKITVSGDLLTSDVIAWLSDPDTIDRGMSRLRNRGFSHLIIKTESDNNNNNIIKLNSEITEGLRVIQVNMDQFKIFQFGDFSLFALQ